MTATTAESPMASESARIVLAAILADTLGASRSVIPAAISPEQVIRPTVLVWQDTVSRGDVINAGVHRAEVRLTVWLLVGNEDPLRAEDELEALLGDVIDALASVHWCDWTTAERLIYADDYHGYKLALTASATIGE